MSFTRGHCEFRPRRSNRNQYVRMMVPPENSMQPIAEVLSSIPNRRLNRLAALPESDERNSLRCTTQRDSLGANFSKEMQRVARWVLAFSGSLSFVAVVQPTDLRHRHNRPNFWRLNHSQLRRVLPQRKMRSGAMIILEIRTEDFS